MGILDSIRQLFESNAGAGRAYWVHVACDRCGEKIRTRIDLEHDLSPRYDDPDRAYRVHKTLVGTSGCFQRVEVDLSFDKNRNLVDRTITGGEFISEEDYKQAKLAQATET